MAAGVINDDPDIIIGSETHLDSSILDAEFLPPNYNLWRNDRNRLGGGVIVLYKNDLQVHEVRSSKTVELIAVKVSCQGRKPLILCAVYRRPNNDIKYMNDLLTK